MNPLFKKFRKSKKPKDPLLAITDTYANSSSEPASSTSTSTADPMPSALASAATASLRAILAPTGLPPVSALPIAPLARLDPNSPSITTGHELRVSSPVSSVARLDTNSTSSPDSRTIMQANVISTESQQNLSTQSGSFANAQNVLVTGGTFNYNVNIFPADTGEGPTKIPIPEKPNSSPFFTGRKVVLDKLREIFHHSDSKPASRHSCLLWGMGGIGKTQICLKFIEEMSLCFTHVFWVDASSQDSITMSIKGICSFPAAQHQQTRIGSIARVPISAVLQSDP